MDASNVRSGRGAAFSATDPFDFNQHSERRKTAWLPKAIRIGPGELGICVNGVELAYGVHVDDTWLSGAVSLEATAHADSMLIGFFSGDGFRLQGAPMPTMHLCVTPPGACWDAASRRNGQWQAVHLSGPALRASLGEDAAALVARLSEVAAGGTIIARPTEEALALHRTLQAILRGATPARRDGDAAPLERVQHLVQVVLRELLSGSPKALTRTGHRRTQVARAAARMIREGAQAGGVDALDLDDVARALGVSRRTVQLAFSEYFGVSFRTLYHSARLHRAHAMIRAHGHELSVSQIATRCGFAHLGRFSRYYHRLFGRLPRETRRQSWGGHIAERDSGHS